MARCGGLGGAARHWFSFYGMPGFRSPVCRRCGAPNPVPLTEDEWADLAAYRAVLGRLDGPTEAALNAHLEEAGHA
jgi:hypothetical protein